MIIARVPGSTSNLGHGFDCMGIAIGRYNELSASEINDNRCTSPHGDGLINMVEALRAELSKIWGNLPSLDVHITGDVPISRGLGSSCTILLGAAAIWQQLIGREWNQAELIAPCVAVEGHPDNVVASCLGGLTLAGTTTAGLCWQQLQMPDDWRAVLTIPDTQMGTADSRGVLPDQLSIGEAITGWQRSALITAAIAQADASGLTGLFDQAWHERYRGPLNPALDQVRHIAAEHGAIGTWLSGSGSTVLSLCHDNQTEVVCTQLAEADLGSVSIANFDKHGTRIISQ